MEPKAYTHGAFAAVIDNDKILLVKLPVGSKPGNKWAIPGGVVDPGESPEDGAVREVSEETGVTCKITKEIWDLPTDDLHLKFYLADYISGEIIIQEDEIEEADWFTYTQLDSLEYAFDNVRRVVEIAFSEYQNEISRHE